MVKIIYVHSKNDFDTHQFSAGLNNAVTHVRAVSPRRNPLGQPVYLITNKFIKMEIKAIKMWKSVKYDSHNFNSTKSLN